MKFMVSLVAEDAPQQDKLIARSPDATDCCALQKIFMRVERSHLHSLCACEASTYQNEISKSVCGTGQTNRRILSETWQRQKEDLQAL